MKVWDGFFGAGLELAPSLPVRRWISWRLATVVGVLIGAAGILVLLAMGSIAYALGSLGLLLAIGLTRSTVGAVAPADTVVLVGRSPMASVITSLLTDVGDRPRVQQRRAEDSRLAVLRAMSVAEASAAIRAARCDEVIVTDGVGPRPLDLLDARGRRPTVTSGIDAIERLLGRVPLELLAEDRWLTRLGHVRSLDRAYAAVKRGLDVVIALAIGFGVMLALPLLALAIRLDSAGPVFYSQERVGLGGRTFRIYKFRTMRQDAERAGAVWAQQRDPRVTRIGRFLRLSRIDELPQVWNVLRGDMTLVGPRPERPEFTGLLEGEFPAYSKRYAVKPGLTGWAQVCYQYTNSVRDVKAKLEYDLYYIKHASLRLDLTILLRTIGVMLRLRGQ